MLSGGEAHPWDVVHEDGLLDGGTRIHEDQPQNADRHDEVGHLPDGGDKAHPE